MSIDPSNGFGTLPFSRIAERCRQESARFFRRVDFDPRFCFELFRRALVDNDQAAWQALETQYTRHTPIVLGWAMNHPSFRATGEDADVIVNGAFFRMWKAFNRDPDKFAAMKDLPSLLHYLKMCVDSEIKDRLEALPDDPVELDEATEVADRHAVDDDFKRAELWQEIEERLNDDQEWNATYARYMLGMRSNDIFLQHPDLFASVEEVYSVLQNVLRRLRRDADLLAEYGQDS